MLSLPTEEQLRLEIKQKHRRIESAREVDSDERTHHCHGVQAAPSIFHLGLARQGMADNVVLSTPCHLPTATP